MYWNMTYSVWKNQYPILMKYIFFLDSLISIGKPFDRTFNIKDEEAFYCTELIYKTFIQIGLSEIEKVKFDDYLYPNDFINSGLFVKL